MPLNKIQTQSLDFVINRLLMKLFNTSDIALVKQCQEQFDFTQPSVHSSGAARNLRTSFAALTSSRDQALVYAYVRLYTSVDIALPLFFVRLLFFCILLPYVVNKDVHN